jgi:hypothetical protein
MVALTGALAATLGTIGTAVSGGALAGGAAIGLGTAVAAGTAAGAGALIGGISSSAQGGNFGEGALSGLTFGIARNRSLDPKGGAYPSAQSASTSSRALTLAQLQAGNANISNTLPGYSSNTLNTARGRLLNI